MTEGDKVRLHAIIEGRVQGVGFRAFVIDKATDLGVTGWVRNRWGGSVEIMAENDRTTLEKLLGALRQGPRAAYVTQVRTEWQTASGEFYGFSVRSTN
ncbi:MAG: acylphosphatase [Chloroflexi bacterium RBG_19FT_COMBO_55_16]|nr:MAG: acylphosphatase [Chloroflexi bacterium RBG_19FT_COMBO_55_16]